MHSTYKVEYTLQHQIHQHLSYALVNWIRQSIDSHAILTNRQATACQETLNVFLVIPDNEMHMERFGQGADRDQTLV